MSEEEIEDLKRRAERLRREIERHNRLYHDEAAPEIPDPEFDVLFRALRDLEEKQGSWLASLSMSKGHLWSSNS